MDSDNENYVNTNIKTMIKSLVVYISFKYKQQMQLLNEMCELESSNNWSHTLRWIFVNDDMAPNVFYELSITKRHHLDKNETIIKIRMLRINTEITESNYCDLARLLGITFNDPNLIQMKQFSVSQEFIDNINEQADNDSHFYDNDDYDGTLVYEYSEISNIINDDDFNLYEYGSLFHFVPAGFCHIHTGNLRTFYSSDYRNIDGYVSYSKSECKELREFKEGDSLDENFDFLFDNSENISDDLRSEIFSDILGDLKKETETITLYNVKQTCKYIY